MARAPRPSGTAWMYNPCHPQSKQSGFEQAQAVLREPHVKAQDRFLRSCGPGKLEQAIQKRIDQIWGPRDD